MREKLRRARKCKDIWDISYELSFVTPSPFIAMSSHLFYGQMDGRSFMSFVFIY